MICFEKAREGISGSRRALYYVDTVDVDRNPAPKAPLFRGSPSPPSSSRSTSTRSQTHAIQAPQDGSAPEDYNASALNPGTGSSTVNPTSQVIPPLSFRETLPPPTAIPQQTLPPPTAVAHQQPLHTVGSGVSIDQVAPYPQPQVQKRGPPGTPHPFENPAKKQSKWSADENALITELRGNGMKWEDISKRLPGRSAISCRLHYQNFLERKAEWDEEKKNKLARLYDRFKKDMWDPVAKELGMPWRAVEAMHWELGNDGIASRTGVPVFATASATATEPPSMQTNFATATSNSTLPPSLSYSPPSPPKLATDHLHPYQRQQQTPLSSIPQHVNPYANFPPAPQTPHDSARSRQRRSASTAPSSSRQRSTSRKRALSGTNVGSQSPTRIAALPTSNPQVPKLVPTAEHQRTSMFPASQGTENERLPPMRFLTEPPAHEQILMPMPYGRAPEPRALVTFAQTEQGQTQTARKEGGTVSGESSLMGGGGERR